MQSYESLKNETIAQYQNELSEAKIAHEEKMNSLALRRQDLADKLSAFKGDIKEDLINEAISLISYDNGAKDAYEKEKDKVAALKAKAEAMMGEEKERLNERLAALSSDIARLKESYDSKDAGLDDDSETAFSELRLKFGAYLQEVKEKEESKGLFNHFKKKR